MSFLLTLGIPFTLAVMIAIEVTVGISSCVICILAVFWCLSETMKYLVKTRVGMKK